MTALCRHQIRLGSVQAPLTTIPNKIAS